MNNNYMIIFSKGIRVPLLAEDGIYKLKCGRRVMEIPACAERWMINDYYQRQQKTDQICWWIRTYFDPNIKTSALDAAIKQFAEDHPNNPGITTNVNNIPLYATETEDLEIPLPANYKPTSIYIDRKTEKKWLDLVFVQSRGGTARLFEAIGCHCLRYGISDSNDFIGQIKSSFLEQHGLIEDDSNMYVKLTEVDADALCPSPLWWKLGKSAGLLFLIYMFMDIDIDSLAGVWGVLTVGFVTLMVCTAIVMLWDTWAPPQLRALKRENEY